MYNHKLYLCFETTNQVSMRSEPTFEAQRGTWSPWFRTSGASRLVHLVDDAITPGMPRHQEKVCLLTSMCKRTNSLDWFCWENLHRKPMVKIPWNWLGFPVSIFPSSNSMTNPIKHNDTYNFNSIYMYIGIDTQFYTLQSPNVVTSTSPIYRWLMLIVSL